MELSNFMIIALRLENSEQSLGIRENFSFIQNGQIKGKLTAIYLRRNSNTKNGDTRLNMTHTEACLCFRF